MVKNTTSFKTSIGMISVAGRVHLSTVWCSPVSLFQLQKSIRS